MKNNIVIQYNIFVNRHYESIKGLKTAGRQVGR